MWSKEDRDKTSKALVRHVFREFRSFFETDKDDMLNRSVDGVLYCKIFRLDNVEEGYEGFFDEACHGCYWGFCTLGGVRSLGVLIFWLLCLGVRNFGSTVFWLAGYLGSSHLDLRLSVWLFDTGRMVLGFFLGSHGTLVAVSAPFMMPLRDSGHSNECSLYVL
jgi:hypothetical protein